MPSVQGAPGHYNGDRTPLLRYGAAKASSPVPSVNVTVFSEPHNIPGKFTTESIKEMQHPCSGAVQ